MILAPEQGDCPKFLFVDVNATYRRRKHSDLNSSTFCTSTFQPSFLMIAGFYTTWAAKQYHAFFFL